MRRDSISGYLTAQRIEIQQRIGAVERRSALLADLSCGKSLFMIF